MVPIAVTLVGMAFAPGAGAAALDRGRKPVPGPTPAIATPRITRTTLANGLPVWVVSRHGLPVVSVLVQIRAGSAQDDAHPGLAAMTAALLDEGSAKHSALEFAQATSFLGASLVASSGYEQTSISLLTLTRHLDAGLGLLGEMLVGPSFKPEEVERERTSRLQSLKQARDVASTTADRVFNMVALGADHPYGRPPAGTLASIAAITRDDVLGYFGSFYRPNNAVVIVVGDVTAEAIVPRLESALGAWTAAPLPAGSRDVPAKPAAKPTAVYLVDKPGAAQSEIRIGHAGAPRTADPDYYALQVLNTVLGGQFTSRVNLNLREKHGFTYGARSTWAFRRGAGPFVASSGVFTAKTDSALVEFIKEIRDVRGARPITADEVEFARNALQRGYPRRFETDDEIADVLADFTLYELPESEISNFPAQIGRVRAEDATRVAKAYIAPDRLAIVVVGDLAKIRPGIEALELGPISVLDAEGKPVAAK